ncbi:MAG: hypothetical protein ABSG53_17665 [Thermoguttaceae bacterium]
MAGLIDAEIPEAEVVSLLNGDPVYHDLRSRLAILESNRLRIDAAAPGTKPPLGPKQTQAELDATKVQLQTLEDHSRDLVRNAKRIALQAEIRHLERQVEISAGQIAAFEKEVEKKREDVDSVGRSSISAQMAAEDVLLIQEILRAVAAEQEMLKVELSAGARVQVLGDMNAPAAVPESPD